MGLLITFRFSVPAIEDATTTGPDWLPPVRRRRTAASVVAPGRFGLTVVGEVDHSRFAVANRRSRSPSGALTLELDGETVALGLQALQTGFRLDQGRPVPPPPGEAGGDHYQSEEPD